MRRYKTRVAYVVPESSRHIFKEEHKACFIGISLESDSFTPLKFEEMLRYVSRYFQHCVLLVADSVHRIALEIKHGYTPEEALSKALQAGQEYIALTEEIVEKYNQNHVFSYDTFHNVQKGKNYHLQYENLIKYYQSSPEFQDSIWNSSHAYNKKREDWDRTEASERESRIQKSCQYFLEEFAVFACLGEQGNSLLIYPGSFESLAEIIQGKHPNVCAELQNMTFVSTRFKRLK